MDWLGGRGVRHGMTPVRAVDFEAADMKLDGTRRRT